MPGGMADRGGNRDALTAHGDVVAELIQVIERISVIVIGWHCRFADGAAECLQS
jgi:hypothetical protein